MRTPCEAEREKNENLETITQRLLSDPVCDEWHIPGRTSHRTFDQVIQIYFREHMH